MRFDFTTNTKETTAQARALFPGMLFRSHRKALMSRRVYGSEASPYTACNGPPASESDAAVPDVHAVAGVTILFSEACGLQVFLTPFDVMRVQGGSMRWLHQTLW